MSLSLIHGSNFEMYFAKLFCMHWILVLSLAKDRKYLNNFETTLNQKKFDKGNDVKLFYRGNILKEIKS